MAFDPYVGDPSVKAANAAEKRRVKYLIKKADSGDMASQFLVGNRYKQGEGVNQDETEAIRYWRMASIQGHGPAECMLGKFANRGWGGFEQSQAKAGEHYEVAAERGDEDAMDALAKFKKPGYLFTYTRDVPKVNRKKKAHDS
eukprot:CAMPEP_0172606202 /NCGR_PEP_ID=MMETSP1068-20121228/26396_1 /TAXON_ID=35684 /ORGANISM="Pseudopedinella elastica, Strain CCMP716" /LENGTH=142 /DNA_ID=CAMNT_0013408851 /DNA_START=53 /DNA_END=481 /DNA_ORIENTATION=-